MWIILGILISFSAFAFDTNESISNVKILKALSGNIVLLNRGLEDGLTRNDHIKISNEVTGFSSRAICLKAKASTSYWRLYRLPLASAFSKDYGYTIVGISDREIPYPQDKLRDVEQEIRDFEKKPGPGTDPFQVRRDLPERLSERDLLESVGPEKRRLQVEHILDQDRMERDLTDYRFSVYASPFTRQSINEAETMRYGFRGGNIGSKYRLLTQFEQQQTKLKDPVTKQSISTRGTQGQIQFVIHKLSKNFSSLSMINYNSQRFSQYATPKYHYQVGPIGFTYHMYDSKTWEYIDLSYIPLYDMRVTEVQNGNRSGYKNVTQTGLRHGLRLGMKTKINERVSVENMLWIRPYQKLPSIGIESDNLNLVEDFKLIFNISGSFFMDYNLIFQKDKLWRTLSGLPENNTINSINFRYDFDV
jgi:hypothetical protein